MRFQRSLEVDNKSSEQDNFVAGAALCHPELLDLVRLRVAQIDRHQDEILCNLAKLKRQGQSMTRFQQLETWGESEAFNPRERAALALCDRVTQNLDAPLPAHLIRELRTYFTKEDIVTLTVAIMAAHDWSFT